MPLTREQADHFMWECVHSKDDFRTAVDALVGQAVQLGLIELASAEMLGQLSPDGKLGQGLPPHISTKAFQAAGDLRWLAAHGHQDQSKALSTPVGRWDRPKQLNAG